MALAAILAIAVSACGDAPSPTKSLVSVAAHGGLDARQHAVALQAAHRETARPGRSITVATAKLVDGPIRQPNTKWRCTSSPLVRITLIGDFPDITAAGAPQGRGDDSVHAMILTADPQSRHVCLIGVRTGHVVAEPGAVVLFRG